MTCSTIKKPYRKTLLLLFAVAAISIICCGCQTRVSETDIKLTESESSETDESNTDINSYNSSEIDSRINSGDDMKRKIPASALCWIESFGGSDELLMSTDEIDAFNSKITEDSSAVIDIVSDYTETLSGETLKVFISEAAPPSLPAYNENGKQITQAELNEALNNRDIWSITGKVPVQLGIITSRADLRTLPSDMHFYNSKGQYDRLQETALSVGLPVWILHESADGVYWYVQSYFYRGWVRKNCIALANEEDWMEFADPEQFAVITAPLLELGGTYFDMGAKLPLVLSSEGVLTVRIPERDSDGLLEAADAMVSEEWASDGYLDMTWENLMIQAFSYEGTPYSWGGSGNGVDCSSFTDNILLTFGIILPRNTSQMRAVQGLQYTSFDGMDEGDVLKTLSELSLPALLFKKGHVMLFLGMSDGSPYIIHAPSEGKSVTCASLSDPDELVSALEIK